MYIKKIASVVFVSVLAACQPNTQKDEAVSQPEPASQSEFDLSGVKLIDDSSGMANEQSFIPYKKYQLENGLTVVLHQDNSDPLVHVDVTYHVGSAREELGKSGFAHFFEHMMFQGSKHVDDDEHFKIITEAGGDMNGTTNTDRTNYYQTVPSNQVEKVLWLEADRMGFLLESVTQEKFEVQRDTVKNERGQRYDNQPYGLLSERTGEALYPAGHPYSWSTIGYVEDLDRVSVEDLKAFFKRWYGPNNAVLTIGGDIDENQILAWVKKYFGGIPAGPAVEDAPKDLVELEQDRYVTLPDEVHLPLIQLTFPTVYIRHEDEAPLDVLSNILGGGKTSLFYKNLVKDGYAVQALVSHPCSELACEFQLIALANPANSPDLASVEQRIYDTLIEFEQRGVEQDDLDRTKASIESRTIFSLQSVAGKVSTLASDQTFDGKPDMVQFDLDRYNNVTADDVMRVYKHYIKDKVKVVVSVVPMGREKLAAAPENYALPKRDFTNMGKVLSTVKAPVINDDFDRSLQPKAGPTPVVKIPEFEQRKLENGIRFVTHQTTETPTVSLSLSLEGGPLLDPIERAGLAYMTAQMMNEATTEYSNEAMANELALLGSSIQFNASGRFTQVTVSSLSKHLDKTLVLLQSKLFKPAFLQEDFDRLKQRTLQSLQQQSKDPASLAGRAVSKLLFGTNNRVGLPDVGTIETLQNIKLDDVKSFYKQYYSPTQANLVVVGDLNTQQALDKLDFLADWKGEQYHIPDYQAFPDIKEGTIYLVDQPGAAQSVVRIIKPGMPYDATGEQFKSKLMNFALGGMFNSRINLNLREDKGYTYGASSNFVGGKTLGWFQAGADLKQDNTADGIQEFFREINRYRKSGIQPEELALMRSAYTQGDALRYETPSSKAAFLRHLLTYELDKSYRAEQSQIINTISQQEINQLAVKHLSTSDMVVIVVGDASIITEQLKSLDKKIVPLEITM